MRIWARSGLRECSEDGTFPVWSASSEPKPQSNDEINVGQFP